MTQAYQQPQHAAPKPAKPKKGTGRLAFSIYGAIVGLILGAAAYADDTTTTTAAAPKPAPTVTVTAQPKVETKTKTVTKRVEVVPDACIEAVRQGDRAVDALQWLHGWTMNYLDAVSRLDVNDMNDLAAEILPQAKKYEGVIPQYEQAAKGCRSAAS